MKVEPPRRATRRRTIEVQGDADTVFALLCPVREVEWLESWKPLEVFSHSGVAERECVFVSDDGRRHSTWMITDHDAKHRRVRMVKFTPGFTVCLLEIAVASGPGATSLLDVCYSFTALSEAGNEYVNEFSEQAYDGVMAQWQQALDHFIAHGAAMPGS